MERVDNIEIHEQGKIPLVLNLLWTKFHKQISEFWARMVFAFQIKVLALYKFFKDKENMMWVDILNIYKSA